MRIWFLLFFAALTATLAGSASAAAPRDQWRCFAGQSNVKGISVFTCTLAGRYTHDRQALTRVMFENKYPFAVELMVHRCTTAQGRQKKGMGQFAYHLMPREIVPKALVFAPTGRTAVRTSCTLRAKRLRK